MDDGAAAAQRHPEAMYIFDEAIALHNSFLERSRTFLDSVRATQARAAKCYADARTRAQEEVQALRKRVRDLETRRDETLKRLRRVGAAFGAPVVVVDGGAPPAWFLTLAAPLDEEVPATPSRAATENSGEEAHTNN